MTSPLLPKAVYGTIHRGIFHETDWHATFAALAGVHAPNDIDGVNAWPTLVNPTVKHRSEVLISGNILRQDKWKLAVGSSDKLGQRAWYTGMLKGCMLGNGGGWMEPPKNKKNSCPGDIYTTSGVHGLLGCPIDVPSKTNFSVTAPIDLWLCSVPCTPQTPCLWDLETDPYERTDVAAENPSVVANLLARLRSLQMNFSNSTTILDNGRFCEAVNNRTLPGLGGFLGPWID